MIRGGFIADNQSTIGSDTRYNESHSSIQTATFNTLPRSDITNISYFIQAHQPSSIFASSPIVLPCDPTIMLPSNIAIAGPSTSKPRPRPRPAWKGSGTLNNNPIVPQTASSSSISNVSSPHPNARTSFDPISTATSAPVVDSTISDGFSFDIAERAKLRSRAATTRAIQPVSVDNVIDITSDDELSFLPSKSKSKSKSKPKSPSPKKRTKTSHSLPPLDPEPIAIPDISFSSQLPPSDPPSTFTVPSTPPLIRAPTISPTSSPFPAPVRKRKRPSATSRINESEDDEDHTHTVRRPLGEMLPPPPPPFFASSSPSALAILETQIPSSSIIELPGPPPNVDFDTHGSRKHKRDEGEEPPMKASKQPRKSGKTTMDDDDWDGDVVPKPKTKPKPKPRPKPKNAKKGKQDASASVASSSKGKEKAKAPTSREFVEDSEEEGGGLILPPPHLSPSEKVLTSATLDNSSVVLDESELSSLDSEIEVQKPGAAKQKPKATPAKTSKRAKTKGRQQMVGVVVPAIVKGKKRAVEMLDDEADVIRPPNSHDDDLVTDERQTEDEPRKPDSSVKENIQPPAVNVTPMKPSPNLPSSSASKFSSTPRTYSISSKKNTPMSELIRKVNSLPGSPFSTPHARVAYSPLQKASRSLLKKIAPLHPNRRTPPPPPPRPPPPKKTKKQLEREEKWEMELEESVEGWYCLSEAERAVLRKGKRDMEMGYED